MMNYLSLFILIDISKEQADNLIYELAAEALEKKVFKLLLFQF